MFVVSCLFVWFVICFSLVYISLWFRLYYAWFTILVCVCLIAVVMLFLSWCVLLLGLVSSSGVCWWCWFVSLLFWCFSMLICFCFCLVRFFCFGCMFVVVGLGVVTIVEFEFRCCYSVWGV